jgi:competence protein ComEC
MRRSWSRGAGAPAIPAALSLAAGILAAVSLPVSPSRAAAVALAGLGILGLALGEKSSRKRSALFAVVLFVAIGFLDGRERFLLPAQRAESVAREAGDDAVAEVVGRIASPWAASGRLRRAKLDVKSASIAGRAVSLDAPLTLAVAGESDPSDVADAGDLVRVRGPLRLPDEVSARSVFRLPGEPRLTLKAAAQIERLDGPSGPLGPVHALHQAIKRRLKTNLAGASPEERNALALLLALLMGETADLPGTTVAAFRDGGVAHILSISGLHVGLVAIFFAAALGLTGISVRTRDAAVLIGTVLFAVFGGGRPPVLRAALMIGLYLTARLLGRPTSPGHVFGFAAVVLLLADPANLFDIGFLLTFAAVFGLSAFGAPVAAFLKARGMRPAVLADTLGATAGAELAVFPVQAFVFNVVPLVGLLSNPVVVPLSGLFLGLALALMPFLLASPAAAALALVPLRLIADLVLLILSALDGLRAVRFIPTPPFQLAAGCAALLVAAGLSTRPIVRRAALAGAAGLVLFLLLRPGAMAGAGTARLQALDVGQGDAWLLQTPTGRVLVDGGGSMDADYEFGRQRLLPKLGDRGAISFDAVVLTHPHPDHSRGLLGVVGYLPVGALVVPRNAPRNVFLDEITGAAARRGLPLTRLGKGESFLAAGLSFEVLHPGEWGYARSKENNGSLVLKVRLPGGRTLLLTGDVEAAAEADLLAGGMDLAADVLKVPHHGSRTSTGPDFLAAVSPRVGLVGVGRHNRFGHPGPEVLERLRAARVRVFRTDRDGEVALVFGAGRIRPEFPEAFP